MPTWSDPDEYAGGQSPDRPASSFMSSVTPAAARSAMQPASDPHHKCEGTANQGLAGPTSARTMQHPVARRAVGRRIDDFRLTIG